MWLVLFPVFLLTSRYMVQESNVPSISARIVVVKPNKSALMGANSSPVDVDKKSATL